MTVAVMLGSRITYGLAALFYLLALVTALLSGFIPLAVLAGIALALIGVNLLGSERIPATMAAKIPILLLTLLAGTFYPAFFVFIIVLVWLTRVYYRRRFNMVYPSLT
jgi:hypothetical protein